ncbi:MAG: hypothetical protein IJX24_06985 [Oscillospiraceae bacterium]|nr:hypothetical protein [Oscillospiraceae bacterium]
MLNNENVIRKNAIETSTLTSGILNSEQSKMFVKKTFEVTNLGPLVRHEMRRARIGEIDKLGISSRLLREKTENTDDGYRVETLTSKVEYKTTAVRIPWEITEEALRENIEGQGLESSVGQLIVSQLGCDLEDIYLNGDEETDSTAEDYEFLKINDGWVKQIKNGGHIYDASDEEKMSIDMFYNTLSQLPNKYNNGKLRWLMSPRRAQEWALMLINKAIGAGASIPESIYTSPANVPIVECASLSDDIILLTDPKNLIVVNTYDVKLRKTTEGKEAIMKDKRFYVAHLDFDPVIEELDATAIITGLK